MLIYILDVLTALVDCMDVCRYVFSREERERYIYNEEKDD